MYSASGICVRFPFNYLEGEKKKRSFESFGIYLLPHLRLAVIEKQLASGFVHLYKNYSPSSTRPFFFFFFFFLMDFAVVAGVVEYVRVFNQKAIIEQLRDIL